MTGIAIALGCVLLYAVLIGIFCSIIGNHFNDDDEDEDD